MLSERKWKFFIFASIHQLYFPESGSRSRIPYLIKKVLAINETFINTTTEGYTTEPPYTGAPTLGYNKRGIILKINF
jgi:hypothetical protein